MLGLGYQRSDPQSTDYALCRIVDVNTQRDINKRQAVGRSGTLIPKQTLHRRSDNAIFP